MKKLILVAALFICMRAHSQNRYVDSVLIHAMKMDSLKFELKLDTVKYNILILHYKSEKDLLKLVGIAEDLQDMKEKMEDDKNSVKVEAEKVIKFYNKMYTREL